MKKLLRIDDTLSNKISYYHILLFLIFLPFDRFYSELVMVSLCLHTLIHLQKKQLRRLATRDLLVLQAVFLLTVLSTIYTSNKSYGVSMITRQLAIFLFPLILLLNPLDLSKYRQRIFYVFSITCIYTILYLYVDAFRTISYNGLPVSAILSTAFFNHNFSLPLNLHATYLSMFAALSFSFLLIEFCRPSTLQKRLLTGMGLLVLLAGLVQLGSRAVMIAVVLIALLNCIFTGLRGRQRSLYIGAVLLGLAACCTVIFSNTGLRNRYVRDLENDLGETVQANTVTPRMERWKLGFELVRSAPLIGHGSAAETDLLSEKYFEHKFYNAFLFRLNSHNQYLSFLIRSGVVGLLIYLYILFSSFRRAYRRKDGLFACFLLLIATVSFSENYLDLNKGIFFYAFFLGFFVLQKIKRRPAPPQALRAGNPREHSAVLT